MNHLVSIITPLYNAQKYFRETAKSVFSQTYENWEWIIVDDCSTDNSFELAKESAKQDKRVVVFKLDKNSGSATARNKALDASRGKYVTFLDADDLLDENYLEKQLKFIESNGPVVSASYYRLTEKTKTIFHIPKTIDFKSILKGNPLSCLTTMYDREVLPNIRFPEDLDRHEDYLFWINVLKTGVIAKGNDEVLATYRLVKTSKNRTKFKLVKPLFNLYHKKIGFNFFKSSFLVLHYIIYSKKKYKGVK